MTVLLYSTFLLLAILALAFFIFWQISNIISLALGAPAVSSPQHRFLTMIGKTSGKTLLDLGCGNGVVCLKAAPLFRQVYGVEYSPFYYYVAKWRTRHVKNVTIIRGNFFTMQWPQVDFIYCYLFPELLHKLEHRIDATGATVLSLSFPIPQKKESQVIASEGYKLYVYRSLIKK